MRAVITAGGRITGEYAARAGTDVKALAAVRGATMLDRCIDALRGAGATEIAVVGGEAVKAACEGRVERTIDEAPTGTENLVKAMRAWPDDGASLIYATSDMPYVSAQTVGDFLERAPRDHVAMPLAEMAEFDARFPGAPPCGIVLNGEHVVNGDVFYIPGGCIERVQSIASRFFEARKHPWQMASLVSPRLMVRFLFKRLGVGHIEEHARKVLGVSAVAVRRCAPELALDADTLADYDYACANP
ncbi:MAG: NTP transferase domain-containing protein [Candidatus Eremiobacteraeota bacterium]|nr:NTP transferase domain-containing protein [Candidatus Eremiobacteraeota bacterium]